MTAFDYASEAIGRTRKQLFTQRKGGVEIFAYEAYNEDEEAQFVVDTIASLTAKGECAPGDCAVMYRTNAQSRAVEETFVRANIPYRIFGGLRFYERKEIKDIVSYLRAALNPDSPSDLKRIINVPTRGIGVLTKLS